MNKETYITPLSFVCELTMENLIAASGGLEIEPFE